MAADSGFTHRQTMAGAVRFNSLHLHEEASRIAEAGGHALAAEEAHFEELVGEVAAARERDRRDRRRARPDRRRRRPGRARGRRRLVPARDRRARRASRSRAGATRWSRRRWRAAGERFVANDCRLGPDDRLWLVGGPNMGGKSTFLRQNALIVLLAQAGGFVPAARATVGLVDRLFSRVGASDNLARGRSTFMVEMVETAAILAQATERSFVILDEVGRGTSTYDGLALAWAVAEAIHETNRCRCLFATHYHELARLAETCPALSLHHVRAKEWKGELVLLHEVAEGAADRSYGLAVAKLAGVAAGRAQRAPRTCSTGSRRAAPRPAGSPRGSASCRCSPPRSQAEEEHRDTMRERLAGARHRRAQPARGARPALRAQARRRRAMTPIRLGKAKPGPWVVSTFSAALGPSRRAFSLPRGGSSS